MDLSLLQLSILPFVMISNERASTYSLRCNICLRQIIYKVVAIFAVFHIFNFLGKCPYSEKPTAGSVMQFQKIMLHKYEARI